MICCRSLLVLSHQWSTYPDITGCLDSFPASRYWRYRRKGFLCPTFRLAVGTVCLSNLFSAGLPGGLTAAGTVRLSLFRFPLTPVLQFHRTKGRKHTVHHRANFMLSHRWSTYPDITGCFGPFIPLLRCLGNNSGIFLHSIFRLAAGAVDLSALLNVGLPGGLTAAGAVHLPFLRFSFTPVLQFHRAIGGKHSIRRRARLILSRRSAAGSCCSCRSGHQRRLTYSFSRKGRRRCGLFHMFHISETQPAAHSDISGCVGNALRSDSILFFLHPIGRSSVRWGCSRLLCPSLFAFLLRPVGQFHGLVSRKGAVCRRHCRNLSPGYRAGLKVFRCPLVFTEETLRCAVPLGPVRRNPTRSLFHDSGPVCCTGCLLCGSSPDGLFHCALHQAPQAIRLTLEHLALCLFCLSSRLFQ